MNRFFSTRFSSLVPYVAGEQPQNMKYIKLNTNESPFPPSPKVSEAIVAETESLRLYPDLALKKSIEAVAAYHGLKKENVFLGNGSDEVLALVYMTFFDEKKQVVAPDISYGFYPVYCDLYGLKYNVIPLKEDFSVDVAAFAECDKNVIIANPNAPTGRTISVDDVRRICENRNRLVVIDEAYVDFGADTCVPLIKDFDNLLVIRTLSKSRSLAGARLGYALGSEGLISCLNSIKFSFNSYNVNRLTDAAGKAAMEDTDYFETCRTEIIRNREYIVEELTKLGFSVLPSKANFVFATHGTYSAKALYLTLKSRGILVRYFDKPRIDNFVRITIGTREQMEILANEIRKILNEEPKL